MENTHPGPSGPNAAPPRPRRRLKPEVAARRIRAAEDDVSRLYEKPVDQLTPLELQMMKQAFFRDL